MTVCQRCGIEIFTTHKKLETTLCRPCAKKRQYSLTYLRSTHSSAIARQRWLEIGKLCWWCRQPLDDRDIHRDHVIPITKGGGGGENIVFSCATCNKKKTDKMPQEWLGISDFLGEPVGIGDLFEVLPDPTHHAGAEE